MPPIIYLSRNELKEIKIIKHNFKKILNYYFNLEKQLNNDYKCYSFNTTFNLPYTQFEENIINKEICLFTNLSINDTYCIMYIWQSIYDDFYYFPKIPNNIDSIIFYLQNINNYQLINITDNTLKFSIKDILNLL